MGVLGDFLQGGQDRRRWLEGKGQDVADTLSYYLGPGVPVDNIARIADAFNPVGDMTRAGTAARGVVRPGATAMERVNALGNVATDMASVLAPVAGAAYADDAARGLTEGLANWTMPADDAAARFVADQSGALNLDPIRARYPGVKLDVSETSDGGYRVSRIVVPPEQRGEGVGTEIMRDILRQADADGARVSLTPSGDFGGNVNKLRAWYKDLGFVDNKGRAKDYAVSDAMYREPQGVPLSPAEARAQEVLDLLASGRASEVTDDMMAAADPQYLFRNYDLPMDEASRMARADRYWPGDGYHGGSPDISEMRPSGHGILGSGVYAGKTPEVANEFADGGAVYPIRYRAGNMATTDDFQAASDDVFAENSVKGYGPESRAKTELLASRGFSGVDDGDAVNIYNPANIRSRFARFDPRLSHLRNLSAGVGGLGVLLGLQQPSTEDELRAYLQ